MKNRRHLLQLLGMGTKRYCETRGLHNFCITNRFSVAKLVVLMQQM